MGRLLSLTPQASADGEEVSVYVKGFNSRSHNVSQFTSWLRCHLELAEERGWSENAFGFDWDSGWVYSFRGIPVPFLSISYGVWRISHAVRPRPRISRSALWMMRPRGFFTALLVDFSLMGARLWSQFSISDNRARDEVLHSSSSSVFLCVCFRLTPWRQAAGRVLAGELQSLRTRFRTVRVIAHSLGCAHVVHAVAMLAPDARPDEVHLLAPAVTSAEAGALQTLAQRMTYVYHCDRDMTCGRAFRLLRREVSIFSYSILIRSVFDV
jgi:hypothetical protein